MVFKIKIDTVNGCPAIFFCKEREGYSTPYSVPTLVATPALAFSGSSNKRLTSLSQPLTKLSDILIDNHV